MMNAIWVGLGGFFGAIARYSLGGLIQQWATPAWFPLGTAIVNIIGCFLFGFLFALFDVKQILNPQLRLLIFVGLLGGFTTFSSFGWDSINLLRQGHLWGLLINVLGQVILGLSAVYLGYILFIKG